MKTYLENAQEVTAINTVRAIIEKYQVANLVNPKHEVRLFLLHNRFDMRTQKDYDDTQFDRLWIEGTSPKGLFFDNGYDDTGTVLWYFNEKFMYKDYSLFVVVINKIDEDTYKSVITKTINLNTLSEVYLAIDL